MADGWDDDFDFDDDDDDSPDVGIASSEGELAHKPAVEPAEEEEEGDGWAWQDEDETDSILDNNEKNQMEKTNGHHQHKTFSNGAAAAAAAPSVATLDISTFPGEEDGWGGDDLDNLEDNQEGWGNDDDDLADLDSEEMKNHGPTSGVHIPSPPHLQELRKELETFLTQLQHLQPSLNAVLESEMTTEKALELVQYYASRQQELHQYTLQKELPRMTYTVISEFGDVLVEKQEVADYMQGHASHSLLSACANQSLLADWLQSMTAADLLIRPQFHAAAVAERVQFRLDYTAHVVHAHAQFTLSLPTTRGRWNIAQVPVQVVFGCDPVQHPFLNSHVERVERLCSNDGNEQLESVLEVLNMLQEADEPDMLPPSSPNHNSGAFRDQFWQQGLQNAWAEMNSATGFSNKLQQMPKFLPPDVLEAAEKEQHHAAQKTSRPTSILGGLVRGGWHRLAQTVTLPEEDTSLYYDDTNYGETTKNPLDRLAAPPQQQQNKPFDLLHGHPKPPPKVNPLDRLSAPPKPPPPQNPLDRLVMQPEMKSIDRTALPSQQIDSPSQLAPRKPQPHQNSLDRVVLQPKISSTGRSTVPAQAHPLDRLTTAAPRASLASPEPSRANHPAPHDRSNPPVHRVSASTVAPTTESTASEHQATNIGTGSSTTKPMDPQKNPLDSLATTNTKPHSDLPSGSSLIVSPSIEAPSTKPSARRGIHEEGWEDLDHEWSFEAAVAVSLPPDYQYDPTKDIIPTRRRWPGSRLLTPMAQSFFSI